jgi:hypothetical protein
LPAVETKVKRLGPLAFVLGTSFLLGGRLFQFISDYSVNVLFWDDWDFRRLFFLRDPGFKELFFLEHPPHREGLGLILDKFILPLTAWNTRSDSFLMGACIFGAMLLALLLKKRLLGRIDYWDALIPAVFLVKSQWELFAGAPNPAYSAFPLLMLMLYALALIQRNYLARSVAVLLLNFLLIYTGYGIFAGALTITLFVFDSIQRRRGNLAIPAFAPPAGIAIACLSLASFFIDYKFDPAVDCFAASHPAVESFAGFLSLFLASYFGIKSNIVGATLFGALLLLLLIFVLAISLRRTWQDGSRPSGALVSAMLLSYSLLFMLNVAYGRSCLGATAGQAPRYPTFLIPAFLSLYFFFLTTKPRWLKSIALAAFAFALIPGHFHAVAGAEWYRKGKLAWADCYRKHEDIAFCDAAANFKIYPYPAKTDLKRKLDFLKKNKLNLFSEPPTPPAEPPSDRSATPASP